MQTILLQPGDPEGIFGGKNSGAEKAGGNLPGLSTIKDIISIVPEQCIELISFKQEMMQKMDEGSKTSGRPVLNAFICTKYTDMSSVKLYDLCLRYKALGEGKERPTSIFVFDHPNHQISRLIKYSLRNAHITNMNVQSGLDDFPTEQFSLNFTEVLWTWYTLDDKGKVTGQNTAGWSVTMNKPIVLFTD